MNKSVKTLFVLFVLLGLPAFAWYFLESGTKMRKEALVALKPKEVISGFHHTGLLDIPISEDSLKGKRWLIGIIGADSLRIKNADILMRLYRQSLEEFQPFVFIISGLIFGEQTETVNQHCKWPVSDNHWKISYLNADHVFPFANSVFQIPAEYSGQSIVILLDDNLTVRNFYKLSDKEDVLKLVRHYPVFLSLKN